MFCVPLMEHLTNGQFAHALERLLAQAEASGHRGERSTCGCDCGQPVAEPRTFVSQAHYNIYLSRTPHWGRNAYTKPQ